MSSGMANIELASLAWKLLGYWFIIGLGWVGLGKRFALGTIQIDFYQQTHNVFLQKILLPMQRKEAKVEYRTI